MERPDQLPAELVHEYVRSAHGDLARIQQMTIETPSLVNAVWDWGGGDFESAMGAAAHTGQRAIALYLLENGARLDLFVAVMLGKLAVVKTIIEHFPHARHSLGAHGIPLLVHAKQGGEQAKAVAEYLESVV